MAFSVDDLTQIVAWMTRLAGAEDGWMNLIPRVGDNDEKPTSLRFMTLFGGGSMGVTMCTWIPARHNHHGPVQASLGITHVTSRRAIRALQSLGILVPDTWAVRQDHPRRGLVFAIPPDEPNDQVIGWALRAAAGLTTSGQIRGWRADIYLPAS